ncbi:hypothetical protein Tco_1030436 [Tanacetum coccineum]|uniref:Tf2-1-like SH3-like domain-containing protein n=1 Tax=Tanacetum coccineum TaxID=301880 RepID=A0ABQ5G681_9ASTR
MDTVYGRRWIRRIRNYEYAFSCEDLALIRRVSLLGYGVLVRKEKEKVKPKRVRAVNMTLQSSIKDRIPAAQKEAFDKSAGLQRGLDEMIEHKSDGALYYLDRIWLPLKGDVRTLIMDEAHKSKYSVHPVADKMYYDLKDSGNEGFSLQKVIVGSGTKIGPVAHRLRLPEELSGIHDTFHMSNLKKCLADPTLQVPLDEIQVDAKLNFVKEPMEILEREFKKLKRSRIAIVKVW